MNGSIVSIGLLKYVGNFPTRFSRAVGKDWHWRSCVSFARDIHFVTGLLGASVCMRVAVFRTFCCSRSLGDGSSVSSDIATVEVVR